MATKTDCSSDEGDFEYLLHLEDMDEDSMDISHGEHDEVFQEPIEPAMLESVLLTDPELGEAEVMGPETFEDQGIKVSPSNGGSTSGGPPAKRPRGRPRKQKTPVVGPPPKRQPTPPPVLSAEDCEAFTIRCQLRKEELASLAKKTRPTPEEGHRQMSLLLEDETDRNICCGEWKWDEFPENETPFINQDISFQGHVGGQLSTAALRAKTELDLFRLFMTNEVLDNIVKQTNLYARQELNSKDGGSKNWCPVAREDIMAYIGVSVAMGFHKKGDIRDYWSNNPILETPWFGEVMSGKRFFSIQSFLHVADNSKAATDANGNLYDKLYKVRPLLHSLLTSFPKHFFPGRELSIDEQMIGTKAQCSLLPFIKEKPTKEGIKVWTMCDSKVHYCLNFQIYTGENGESGLAFRVVNDLVSPFFNKGHHIYFDNFYTSPELLAHLRSHGTLAVGTVRQNHLHMPMRLRTSVQKFEDGQFTFLTSHKMTVCRWKHWRDVFCLSTVHGNSMTTIPRQKEKGNGEQRKVQKPSVICDYNKYMGGVNVYDQLLSYYCLNRQRKEWWTKIFWRLIDMAILNSLALWKLKYPEVSRGSHKQFRINLCAQLTAGLRAIKVPVQKRCRIANRLTHGGDPVYFESAKSCAVCKNRNRKIRFGCADCGEGVRLHTSSEKGVPSCFKIFHTMANYNL